MNRYFIKVLLIFITIVFTVGCENEYPDSIFQADANFKANPVINSISPPMAFAGVDTLELTGQNFSPNIEEMEIYFNGLRGEIVSSTPSLIRAVPANITGNTIKIQLRVDGALEFAVFDSYQLDPIIINYGSFDEFDNVFGIECDVNEEIFVSLLGKKIEKIDAELERSIYVNDLLLDKTSQIRFGPEGEIYYLNGIRFLVRLEPNGGSNALFATLPGNAWDLDFDSDKNIYAGGSGQAVYKITPEKEASTVAEYKDVNIKAIRVFDNYVYVAGKYSGDDSTIPGVAVWRNEIIPNSETLGANELVFDFEANYTGFEIQSLEIAADGDLYIGSSAPEAIIVVHPNGSFEPLYPGVLSPSIYAMTWGNGDFLYLTKREIIIKDDGSEKEVSTVQRLNMRKSGAPHFGRQ